MTGWQNFLWYFSPKDHFFGLRIGRMYFRVKGPRARPMFSERHGSDTPELSVSGWRLFVHRDTDAT